MHIVINSLRIYEVPLLPYMDRPADTREGCKHRCTNAAMEYFKSEVMEKAPVYFPQFTYGEPYQRVIPRSGASSNYGKFERTASESTDGRRYPTNVLTFPTVVHTVHPTQKPVELCEYLIRTYTSEGEVVADFCAGSGTTRWPP